MTDVLNAAVLRAFIVSALVGVLTTISTRQINIDVAGISAHPSWQEAALAGLSAFVSGFLLRGFGEGGYDQHRADTNNINKGDVPVQAEGVTVTPAP